MPPLDAPGLTTQEFTWAPELRRCPKAVFTPEVWALVSWWADWKSMGVLPFGGRDLMRQPAHVVEALRTCEYAALEWRSERYAEHEAEMRRQREEAERKAREAAR